MIFAKWRAFGRGASVTSYGLVVGLISIVALVAVSSTGSNANSLMSGVAAVLDTNAPPYLAANATITVPAGGQNIQISSGQLRAADARQTPGNLTLTLTQATSEGDLYLDSDGSESMTGNEALGSGSTLTQADIDAGLLRYTHTGSGTGADGFVITVSDGQHQAGPFSVALSIVNSAPGLSGDPITGILEDTPYTFALSDFGYTDPDSASPDPDSLTIHSFGGAGVLNYNGSTASLPLSMSPGDVGNLSYMPPMGASGVTDTLTVSASDGYADTPQTSFDLTVTAVNDPPVLTGLSGNSINENNSIGDAIGTFSATDAENDSLTYSLASGGDNDSFAISGNQLVADAVFDYEVKTSYSISVTVTDDGSPAQSDSQTYTISIGNEADTTFYTSWNYGPCVQYVNGSTAQFCSSVSNPSCPSGSSQVGSVVCQWHQWCGQYWTNQFRKRVQCAN
ncbi:MAG: hypothetical protein Alpg2KO_20310 [Alphaproteobacteria bacterium]